MTSFELAVICPVLRNLELVAVVLLAALHVAPALSGQVLARKLVWDRDGPLGHDGDVRTSPVHAFFLDAALLLSASFETSCGMLLPTGDVVAEVRGAKLGDTAALRGGASAGVEVLARLPLARRAAADLILAVPWLAASALGPAKGLVALELLRERMRALEALADLRCEADAAHRHLAVGEGLLVPVLELCVLGRGQDASLGAEDAVHAAGRHHDVHEALVLAPLEAEGSACRAVVGEGGLCNPLRPIIQMLFVIIPYGYIVAILYYTLLYSTLFYQTRL